MKRHFHPLPFVWLNVQNQNYILRLSATSTQLKLTSLLFLVILQFVIHTSKAQTFTGSGSIVPDNGTFIEISLPVSGIIQPLNANFGLAKVCFSMLHPNVRDIQIQVVSPSGMAVNLFSGIGWDGDNFNNTCLGGQNLNLIANGSAPFTGNFRPAQSLGHFNNGSTANGIWKLRIRDLRAPNQGILSSWSITFSNQPATPFLFTSSNLPLVLIDTKSQFIPDEPKLPFRIKVINQPNGSRNFMSDSSQFNWIPGGIEQRGSSSADFPKKSYGFEFWNPAGEDTSLTILGMPAESDWILSANYSDKSLMRNTFAYDVARKMGRYASRTRYVELVLNGEYQGIYVLLEKIKRDVNRVNISKLKTTDVSGADVTGGYIVKIDKSTGNDTESWVSTFPPEHNSNGQEIRFFYDYPDAVDIVPAQKAYIKAYIDSFETAVHASDFSSANGYRKYADVPSFVDYFILNEWSRNVDGYRLSTYITKPKITQNGGKLMMGPAWDFDIAWRNCYYCDGDKTTGWQFEIENICPGGYWQPPTWWKKFRLDPAFNNALKCRWTEVVQNQWPPDQRVAWVDSVRNLLQESQQRNFSYWPILGQYVWPNPDPIYSNYAGETAGFQNWLNQRANWITANIGGSCITETESISIQSSPRIYPNPASHSIQIEGLNAIELKNLQLFNTLGKRISFKKSESGECIVSSLGVGLYWFYWGTSQRIAFVKED